MFAKHFTALSTTLGLSTLLAVAGCVAPTDESTSTDESIYDDAEDTSSRVNPEDQGGIELGARIGDLGDGPLSIKPTRIQVQAMSDEETQLLTAEKQKIPSGYEPATPRRSVTERTMKTVRTLDPDAEVRIIVMLANPPLDFDQLRTSDENERTASITRRVKALEPSQDALEAALRGLGGHDFTRLWLGGNDVIATVPASKVEAISRLPNVIDVDLDGEGGEPSGYTGNEARIGMLTDSFVEDGFDGNFHSRNGSSQAVRIGIIEHSGCNSPVTNFVAKDHVGFADTAGGTSRVKKVYDCSSGTCETSTSAGGNTHGNLVSGIAAGSIEQGQDSNFPENNGYPLNGTVEQRRRSGHAPEASIYYYGGICSYTSIRVALEKAIAENVDIVNMSFQYESNCDRFLDHGNVNATIASAMNAGVLVVAAAGNTSTSLNDSCNLAWPGWRPDVLNVTGLATSNSATPYRDTNIQIGSSAIGGMTVRTFKGVTSTAAGLGLAAPAVYSQTYGNAPNSYNSGNAFGTSFASPSAAGAAADLRHALNDMGWQTYANNAYVLMANMFLMGDAWNGLDVSAPGGSVFKKSGLSEQSGNGRVRMRWPSSNLVAPWSWGTGSTVIQDKQTITFDLWGPGPESSQLTEWKWVVTWAEPDLNNIADIDISVWNTCPAGGGAPVSVTSQADYDYRNRIRLTSGDIGGKCLQARIYGFNVPVGGRVLYMADMSHSGDPNP